jgi:DNA-binding SARP family transcriptional activator
MSQTANLVLLGGFSCCLSKATSPVPLAAQRLLAYLALSDDGAHRTAAAERLWPDSSPARAAANLRSALWRVRRAGAPVAIQCSGPRLRLAASTSVDLRQVLTQASQIATRPMIDLALDSFIDDLRKELLPGWSDDWLLLERERWDAVRLHTLELLAQQLLAAKRYLPALETALTAIAIEPVRESSHRTVIEVHIAEGNAGCALKHFHQYRAMLHREVGVVPSAQMTSLVHNLIPT